MRIMGGTILAVAVALAARADRIDDIMAKMTLREKIGQCVQIELAKIPLGSEEEAAAWFAKYPIGSVFMGKDLASLTEGEIGNAESLARCAAATKIPLTVAGDLGPVLVPAAMPGNGAMGAVNLDPSDYSDELGNKQFFAAEGWLADALDLWLGMRIAKEGVSFHPMNDGKPFAVRGLSLRGRTLDVEMSGIGTNASYSLNGAALDGGFVSWGCLKPSSNMLKIKMQEAK